MKKALFALFVVAILVLPVVSRAATTDDTLRASLLAQIQQLLQLVAQLQQQLQDRQQNVETPHAAVDQNSLVQISNNFSVTGTASNSSAVIVTLVDSRYGGATDWNTIGGYLHGMPVDTTSNGVRLYSYTAAVTGNHAWSVSFENIPSGTYRVLVYNSDYARYALLSNASLRVGSGTSGTATIDSDSLSNSTAYPFRITGRASDVSQVAVYLLPMTYSGGYDYASVYNAGVNDTPTQYAISSSPSPISVSGGRWSAYFGFSNEAATSYTVVVYDAVSKTRLATGTLKLTDPRSTAGPVINSFYVSPSSVTYGDYSTLFWSASNTAQCGISVLSDSTPGIDLTRATTGSSYTSVTTGALTEDAVYELRCAPLSGSSTGYAVKDVTIKIVPSSSSLPACPATAADHRGENGSTFACMCPSHSSQRSVWGGGGSGTASFYTDDSDICTAGAQAGQMNLSSGGEVDYTIKSGQSTYVGFTRHDITSASYGAWSGSFAVTGPKG